ELGRSASAGSERASAGCAGTSGASTSRAACCSSSSACSWSPDCGASSCRNWGRSSAASAPRSERTKKTATSKAASKADRLTDPQRPADHIDAAPPEVGVTQPRLGVVGYLRFFWRQLTSMRTALVLLLLLALAAVPGSLVPQRSSDPNGVLQYQRDNPDTFELLDKLGVFSTFSSP